MKTLDEVIKACEETISDVDRGVDIEGCYLGATETRDALHYLKKYRTKQNEDFRQAYIAVRNEILFDGKDDNPPLSWQDLKQMEGKPVWVEWVSGCWKGSSKWMLIKKANEDKLVFVALDIAMESYCGQLTGISLGKTWQAYRKERDEG